MSKQQTKGMPQQDKTEFKDTWPELVGKTYDEAKAVIWAFDNSLTVVKVQENDFVTGDYRTDRVRVYVNTEGKVARAPKIG